MTITTAKQLTGYTDLNFMAQNIIDVMEESGLPISYLSDKVERLEGLNKYDCLFWATHALDGTRQQLLADHMGVTLADFQACGRVLKKC